MVKIPLITELVEDFAVKPAISVGKKAVKKALGAFETTKPARIVNATKKGGGYSVNLKTGKTPQSGLAVGRYSNTDPRNMVLDPGAFNRAAAEQHAQTNIKALNNPDSLYGTWVNPEDGKTYLDVSKVFPEGDIRTATKFGERTGQLGGYNFGEGKSFPVGNWEQFIRSPEFMDRLAQMEGEGREYLKQFPTKEWWDMHGGPFEEVYGTKDLPNLAGYIGSTAPGSAPRPNLQTASEYMRRHITGEDIVQPKWRTPEGTMSRNPGVMIGMEKGRVSNLLKSQRGALSELQRDKVREEAQALMGDPNAAVLDRHWVRLSEKPSAGIFAGTQEGAIGKGDSYQQLKGAVKSFADNSPMAVRRPVRDVSADIWTGVRERIKNTSDLFGQKYQGSAIQGDSKSYADQFVDLIGEKAKHLGISRSAMEKLLRTGGATLLSVPIAASPFAVQRPVTEQGAMDGVY
jgi:hypothetical protein